MDEIMHLWRLEIHKAMHLRLAGRASVLREIGRAAAKNKAKVLVEMR